VEIVFRDVLKDPAAMSDLVRHSSEAGSKVPAVPTFVVDRAVLVGFVGAETTGPALAALLDGVAPDSAGVATTVFDRLRASRRDPGDRHHQRQGIFRTRPRGDAGRVS
jgi:hypothetical protein